MRTIPVVRAAEEAIVPALLLLAQAAFVDVARCGRLSAGLAARGRDDGDEACGKHDAKEAIHEIR